MEEPRKHKWSTRPKYRRPGLWRSLELRTELARRLGMTDKTEQQIKTWFTHMRKIGLIPEGAERTPVFNNKGGIQMFWTDDQLEEIYAVIVAHTTR